MSDYHKPKIPSQPVLDYINLYLEYNPKTGEIIKFKSSRRQGDYSIHIGYVDTGQALRVSILGKKYKYHHIAWYLHYKVWPEEQIDHRDQSHTNNKIDNLREATHSLNQSNKYKRSGLPPGVNFQKFNNKYHAKIQVDRKIFHLGSFFTEEEAFEVYKQAYELHYGKKYAK